MSKRELRFKSIEISYFLHSTEDYERVIASVGKTLSIPLERFIVRDAKGHYGNPIRIVRAHLIGKDSRDFTTGFFAKLSAIEKEGLIREMNCSLNEHGNFFIRLDKQALLRGRVALAEVDSVRIKIKPSYNAPREVLLKACEGLLQG